MRWLHGRRVDDPINAYIARTVADAHPDADQIRHAERDAYTAYNRAEQARSSLDEAIYAELNRCGDTAVYTRDIPGRLATLTDRLAKLDHDLHTTTTRIEALHNEPALRNLPPDTSDQEHDAGHKTAPTDKKPPPTRPDNNAGRASKQETRRPRPPAPTYTSPHRGHGPSR